MKERGKNTVQLNGGVSAIAGSFIGFSYSTNNFLGLGENLSLSTTLGTVQRSAQIGFTEPYFLDKPIQVGFTVFTSRYSFDQARQASVLAGTNLIPLFQQLGTNNLLNYVNDSRGFTVFASYPLKRSFARVGIILRLHDSGREDADARGRQLFQLHQLPAHQRAEFAGRNQLVDDYAKLHLQHGEPSDQSDRRQGDLVIRRVRGQHFGRHGQPD